MKLKGWGGSNKEEDWVEQRRGCNRPRSLLSDGWWVDWWMMRRHDKNTYRQRQEKATCVIGLGEFGPKR